MPPKKVKRHISDRPSFEKVNEIKEYNDANGLESLDRDCVQQILHDNDDINVLRNIIGMSKNRFNEQTSHHRFKWVIQKCLECFTIVQVPNFKKYSQIKNRTVTTKGGITQRSGMQAIVFLNKKIDRGIYKMSFKLVRNCKWISCGVFEVEQDVIAPTFTDEGLFVSYTNKGFIEQNQRSRGNNAYGDGNTISMELDMESSVRTLHFFVDDLLQPVSIFRVPPTVKYFICCRTDKAVFELVSLQLLPSATTITAKVAHSPAKAHTTSKERRVGWRTQRSAHRGPPPGVMPPQFARSHHGGLGGMHYGRGHLTFLDMLPAYRRYDDDDDDDENNHHRRYSGGPGCTVM